MKETRRSKKTICLIALLTTPCAQAEPIVLNDNGAWCWFQDERAIVVGDTLFVGSIASATGTEGDKRAGNVEVTTYNLDQQSSPKVYVLHPQLQDDDHNLPALLELPNKNVLAIYAKHHRDNNIRARLYDHTSKVWADEVVMPRINNVTYSNLMRLSKENQGKGRLYNFYRGVQFNPTVDISNDDGMNWSNGQHFIANEGRPYVKYISNNKDEIHFVTTEQHPRDFDNSIYHGYIKEGKVFNSDDHPVHDLKNGPVNIEKLTRVFKGDKNKVAWTVDLHLDKNGQPYTVFSVQVNDGDKDHRKKGLKEDSIKELHGNDIRYYYATLRKPSWWQFNKTANWRVNEIAYAGTRLYDHEQDYSGLAALNPNNPNEIYISSNANPKTGKPLISKADGKRHWELFKGVSKDRGETWSWFYVTKNSSTDNLRPIIPINKSPNTLLLWMRGNYYSYQKTDTDIVLKIKPDVLAPVE